MGEYADMAIDDMLAIDESFFNGYGYHDDDPEWNPFTGRWSRFTPRPKTCKACGQANLWWQREPEGWRLANADGVVHKCSFNFKKFIGNKSTGYLAYLDTIPWPSEEEYKLSMGR